MNQQQRMKLASWRNEPANQGIPQRKAAAQLKQDANTSGTVGYDLYPAPQATIYSAIRRIDAQRTASKGGKTCSSSKGC